MDHRITKNENKQMKQVYRTVIYVAMLSHFGFIIMFMCFHVPKVIIYNIASILFHIGMLYLISKGYYKTVVSCVRIEVMIFVSLMTIFLGWETGFSLYLLAVATVVYICPYERRYIPYLFSLAEFIVFMLLKGIEIAKYGSILTLTSLETDILFVFNAIACFSIIIITAWLMNLSSSHFTKELLNDNLQLNTMVNHDQLTGLLSRRYLVEKFKQCDLENQSIIIAMADIDDFKYINDTYGHDCGDYVLRQLSLIMLKEFDSYVDICRWGGEEFVFVFYHGNYDQVIIQIKEFLEAISQYCFVYQEYSFTITLTFGLSNNEKNKNIHEMMSIADKRLYYGKRTGKNKVVYTDKKD